MKNHRGGHCFKLDFAVKLTKMTIKRVSNKYYIILFICTLIYIVFRIIDYNEASLAVGLSSESIRIQQGVLKNGTAIVPEDIFRGFDILCFENGCCRVRFLAWIFEVVDFKSQLWFSEYCPPHPSFSLTWIFTLILSPIFLFKFINKLTGSKNASWISVILFCLSAGSLSGIVLRDGPHKPLVNFAAIISCYLAVLITDSREINNRRAAKPVILFCFLSVVLLLSFFIDETAWFLYPMVPILFPSIFMGRRKGWYITIYLLLIFCFLFFVTFVAPVMVEQFGSSQFNFWEYIHTPDLEPEVNIWQRFNFNNVLQSGKNLIVSQFIPWGRAWWGLAYIIIIPYLVYLFFCLPPGKKKLLLRSLLLLIVYILFIIFYKGKGAEDEIMLESPYYYGALFSLYMVFPLAILFSSSSKRWGNVLNKVIITYLAAIFMYNFIPLHRQGRKTFEGFVKRDNKLTFSDVYRAWKDWENRETRETFIKLYPDQWHWFFPMSPLPPVRGRVIKSPLKTDNLLNLPGVKVTAEPLREGDLGIGNLFDGSTKSAWKTKIEDEQPEIVMNFTAREGARVGHIVIRPQEGALDDFFRRADLLGSVDGERWSIVARIIQPAVPPPNRWISWFFVNHAPYRIYKLVIKDSHDDKGRISLAEVILY